MKKRFLSLLMAAIVFAQVLSAPAMTVQAGTKTLTLETAKTLAVANSTACEKLENQLLTKQVSLKQAIRSIREKKKNMSTFRWSPLLSFKFPEKPDLSEAYEFQFKPIQIQAEIDSVSHQMTDQVLAEYEKVSNLYVDIVVLEESLRFNQLRLDSMEDALAKNEAKCKLGEAKQSDVDKIKKSIDSLSSKIVSDRRSFEAAKKKLGAMVGMDVSTGYSFQNPFKEASIPRSKLKDLTNYTLERDQSYYDVCMDAETSLISLRTNYSLMEGQYGSKMNYISSYVNQAVNGEKINGKAFKKDYEVFLEKIDEPWQGKKKILFIKIPKVWFKGQISGIRYVEDEPYALYESAMEYQEARQEKNNAKTELEESVEDAFNNYISMQSAYLSSVKAVEEAEESLRRELILNRSGEMTYEEYAASQEDYEQLQNDMFDALAQYSQTLYSFDRLTCGGITALLSGTGAEMNTAAAGESYIEEEYADGAYYYIEPIVQEEAFRLGVSIPDDFSVTITDFELWCDNIQIGNRSKIDQKIQHLSLAKEKVQEVKLRFYNGDTFVDDCIIDAEVYSGPLTILESYQIVQEEQNIIGTYTSETNAEIGMTSITLEPNAEENVAFYTIKTADDKVLTGNSEIAVDKDFQYLSLVQSSMEELIIVFYDKEHKVLYEGYFDTVNKKLMKNPEE